MRIRSRRDARGEGMPIDHVAAPGDAERIHRIATLLLILVPGLAAKDGYNRELTEPPSGEETPPRINQRRQLDLDAPVAQRPGVEDLVGRFKPRRPVSTPEEGLEGLDLGKVTK